MEKKIIRLSHDPTATNYFDSVRDLVYGLGRYIRAFRTNIPELYNAQSKGTCNCKVAGPTLVFLMSDCDRILIDRCGRFAVDAMRLVKRKYREVESYLKNNVRFVSNPKIRVSRDLMAYFSDYQQRLNWVDLASGSYGKRNTDGSDIYDIVEYQKRKEDELNHCCFNNIKEYEYSDLVTLVSFGYAESINTFAKLRTILDECNSLYAALSVIHVYIDILEMMCFVVDYLLETSNDDEVLKDADVITFE